MHLPHNTNNEAITNFISGSQADFDVALQQLHKVQEQMRCDTNQHQRAVDKQIGDEVLLNTMEAQVAACINVASSFCPVLNCNVVHFSKL